MPIPAIPATPASMPFDAGVRGVSPIASSPAVAPVDDALSQRQTMGADGTPMTSGDRKALQAAAEKLNHYYTLPRAELHFSVDDSTKKLVVKMTDARDGTVIRQIPSEEALRLAQALQDESPQLLKQTA